MPPKSKKEQQEQAQRLLEEQKRKEEQEARLALERQRYAAETIKTGLFLPASNQLIIDLLDKPTSFITQKLTDNLKELYPALSSHPQLHQLVIRQLIFYLIEGQKLFGVKGITKIEGSEPELLKVRIVVGLALKLMLNQHRDLGGNGKSLQIEERLFKETLSLHVQEGEGKLKVFNIKELEGVIKSIQHGYFNHYMLLQDYRSFSKRQDRLQSNLYICSPATFTNQKDTNFVDLAQKANKQP